MSDTIVGLLGLVTIVAIVVTLFKSKTQPAIAFIVFPSILGLILVLGGRFTFDNLAAMIKAGFNSTAPTAALFVFSVLYFGIMTDAGMFDVIIGKLMKLIGNNVIGVCVMTCVIALIGHLDGGGASTFCIVVPAMLPIYKKMNMRPTSLLRIAVLAMGVLNLMPWAGPTMRAATVLGMEAGQLWNTIIPIQIFGIVLALAHSVLTGFQEKKRGAGLPAGATLDIAESKSEEEKELSRPKLFWFNLLLTIAVIAMLIWDVFASYVPFMLGVSIALFVNYGFTAKMHKKIINLHAGPALMMCSTLMGAAVLMGVLTTSFIVKDGALTAASVKAMEVDAQRCSLPGRYHRVHSACCHWSAPASGYRHSVRASGSGLRYRLLLLRYAACHHRHRPELRRRGPAHRCGYGRLPELRYLHQPHGSRHSAGRGPGRCGYQGPHQGKLPVRLGLLHPVHAVRHCLRHYASVNPQPGNG